MHDMSYQCMQNVLCEIKRKYRLGYSWDIEKQMASKEMPKQGCNTGFVSLD